MDSRSAAPSYLALQNALPMLPKLSCLMWDTGPGGTPLIYMCDTWDGTPKMWYFVNTELHYFLKSKLFKYIWLTGEAGKGV